MSIYDFQEAFGAHDITSRAMREAMSLWDKLYFGTSDHEPSQRVAYTVVSKIAKAVFGEYAVRCDDPAVRLWLDALHTKKSTALQLALAGGECFLKPCPDRTGFSFTLIPRANVLVFAMDAEGNPTDMGLAEKHQQGNSYFTLLERRTLDGEGRLTITNRLFQSASAQRLGSQVSLATVEKFAALPESYTYPQGLGLGMVRMKTPILNCVDGSADGVAVFAPAVGLIRSIDANEAQLSGEFQRGQSRIIVSRDLLDENKGLSESVFVGLDEDPDRVGITVFAPGLREQSYLARKQEYLRNVESVIGLKRGMLSDANMDERTATEIAASAADYNLTVMDFQQMWQRALMSAMALCTALARLYGLALPKDNAVAVDWGNGVLYDEERIWEGYLQMVQAGLLKPEIALGWRFGMATDTEDALAAIREKYMPENPGLSS